MTVLAIRETGRERQGLVLRPHVEGGATAPTASMPGLVPMLGVDEVEGVNYVLYEFSPGVTLREVFDAFKASHRRAPLGLAGRVVLDAARVISALHTGAKSVVHGCLHDGAVLIGFDGTVRLMDVGAQRRTRYDAPEVAKGEPATTRSDVFGLAAMMHSAATGFGGSYATVAVRGAASSDLPPPSKHHADATVELDAAVFRAMTTNAQTRAASARLFADELERTMAGKLFSREQVGASISELFGDRVASLKSLIARATAETTAPPVPSAPRGSRPSAPRPPPVGEQPTGPRPSGPRARPSRPAAPQPEVHPGSDVPVDTQASGLVLAEIEGDVMPTRPPQARASAPGVAKPRMSRPNIPVAMKPAPPVEDPPPLEDDAPATGIVAQLKAPPIETDSHPVSIGNDPEADQQALGIEDVPTGIRPRTASGSVAPARSSSIELKQQTEEEKSLAVGQEKISTSDLDPENLGELAQLQDAGADDADPAIARETTQVKKKPTGREPPKLDPDDALDATSTKKKKVKKGGAGGRLFLVFLVLVGAFGGLAFKFRPWRGKPVPEWLPPQLAVLAIEDGALPANGEQLQVVPLTDADLDAGEAAPEDQTADAGAQGPTATVDAGVAPVAVAPAVAVDAGAGGPATAIAAARHDAGSADAGSKTAAPPPVDKKKKKRHH